MLLPRVAFLGLARNGAAEPKVLPPATSSLPHPRAGKGSRHLDGYQKLSWQGSIIFSHVISRESDQALLGQRVKNADAEARLLPAQKHVVVQRLEVRAQSWTTRGWSLLAPPHWHPRAVPTPRTLKEPLVTHGHRLRGHCTHLLFNRCVWEEGRQRNKKPQSHDTKEIFIGKSPVSQQCTPRQVQWADVPALCAYPFVINTQYSFIFVTKVLSVHIYVRYNLKYGSSTHINFSTL